MENKGESRVQEWVLHIDGDAFFASVEQSRRPELWGKPVVVGQERGIATALSYEAKALGVKRGDPIFKIKKDYKSVTILSSHFELYNKYATALANILRDKVDSLETYSIDECFATIIDNEENLINRVKQLKKLVQCKLGITYSFGVSVTKVLAKVASKRNKPNGLCVLIDKKEIDEALKDTKVDNIWGLGFATCRKLNSYKIYTAHEFINKTWPQPLQDMFSKNIFEIKDEILGIKRFTVANSNEHKKSIQSTRAFIKATSEKQIVYSELSKNLETALSDLLNNNLYTNRVVFYVKQYKGEKVQNQKRKSIIISHEYNCDLYTQNPTTLSKGLNEFIEHLFDKSKNNSIGDASLYKSSGVILSNLKTKEEIPISLFNDQNISIDKEMISTKMIMNIRSKYGFGIINLASSLNAINNREKDKNARNENDNYEYGLPYKYLGIIK